MTDGSLKNLPDIRFIQVQTQSRCNADCVFCPYSESWHAQHPGVMRDEVWQQILSELQPFTEGINQGKFLLYFMQEPFLDKSLFQKIEDVYHAFPQTRLELSTNAAALTEATTDRLIAALTKEGRRHHIWVSHHGIDKQSLEAIMAMNYEKAHANLIRLLQKADGRLKIRVRGGGESLDRQHRFFTPRQYTRYWKQQLQEHPFNTNNVHLDAFRFHDRAGQLRRSDRNAKRFLVGKVRDIGPQQPFYCGRVDRWLHFMWNGQMRLCCMDYYGEVPLPFIQETGLIPYFQSDTFKALTDTVFGKVESQEDFICKRCLSPGG